MKGRVEFVVYCLGLIYCRTEHYWAKMRTWLMYFIHNSRRGYIGPVTLDHLLANVFEKGYRCNCKVILDRTNLDFRFQIQGCRTEAALITLVVDFYLHLDGPNAPLLVPFSILEAFITMNCGVLLGALQCVGIEGIILHQCYFLPSFRFNHL